MFAVNVAFQDPLFINGLQGINDQSKKFHSSPNQKLTPEFTKLILDLRRSRNLEARHIQTELIRLHDHSLSLASIHNAGLR